MARFQLILLKSFPFVKLQKFNDVVIKIYIQYICERLHF